MDKLCYRLFSDVIIMPRNPDIVCPGISWLNRNRTVQCILFTRVDDFIDV